MSFVRDMKKRTGVRCARSYLAEPRPEGAVMKNKMRAGVFAVWLAPDSASGQVQYAAGQDVAPVFEGWEHNPDGTFSMVFGYLNRNYEEEVDIPIEAANTISIGDEMYGDRGQPT